MKLQDYISQENKKLIDCAAELGISAASVHRYARKGRTPKPDIMNKIVKWSEGNVMPNDFLTEN